MPRVTVVIPIYNRSQALRPTVDSVCAQSFPDWELLLIDDGSRDDTADVCRSYTDPRVRYIYQQNAGQAAGRNHGLRVAAGEYVAFLDHDDRWAPEKLARQVVYLDEHPEVGLVYGQARFVDEGGKDCGPLPRTLLKGWVYADLLREHNFLYTMSLPMMRTALVREVGGFDPSTDLSDDLDLFLRLAKVTQFGCIAEDLLHYNVGNEQQQTRDIWRVYRSERACIERHLKNGPSLPPAELRAVQESWGRIFSPGFRERGWHSLRCGQYRQAWGYYLQSLRLAPAGLRDPKLMRDLLSLTWKSLTGRRSGSTCGAA